MKRDHYHWVELKLVACPKSIRGAVGAKVFLNANCILFREDVSSGGSYMCASGPITHFGLGEITDPGTAEIHWPSGRRKTVNLPRADCIYTITEGFGITVASRASGSCILSKTAAEAVEDRAEDNPDATPAQFGAAEKDSADFCSSAKSPIADEQKPYPFHRLDQTTEFLPEE